MASRPHHLGSPWGKQHAEFMAGLFRSWGYETRIEQYEVLFPTPKERVVEMVAPTRVVATLEEPALPRDQRRDEIVERQDGHRALHDGLVRGLADAGRAALRVDTVPAGDQRDGQPERECLDHALPQIGYIDEPAHQRLVIR